MAVKPISVAIVGDDRPVQKTFDRVVRRMATVASSGERFATGARRLSDDSGVTRLATGFTAVGRRVAGAAESLGRFAPALAGITGAVSIAGLARLVETWTTFGSRLGLDAQRIGMSARNLHSLQGAARLAGSSAEALTSGMTALGDNLTDAVGGRSPETIQMLSTLGIAFQDASGHARTAEAVLPQLADRIAAIKNPALQARAATALFGGAGEALLPFLRRGAAGIADYNAQAARYGLLNQAGVNSANAMREAQARLGLAVEGVGYSISERVAPILVPMLDRLSDWVAAHREQIAGFFGDVATRIERWVDSGGIDRVTTAVTEFGTRISGIVDGVGGATTALEIFFGLWVGAKVIGALAAMVRVTAALRGIGAARAIAGGGGSAALPDVGSGQRAAPRSGIPAFGLFGGPLGAVALGLDMAEGRTREEQKTFSEDSFIAKLGKAMGEAIGMQFDEHGNSAGILARLGAARRDSDTTPGERLRGAAARAAPLPSGEAATRARYAFDRYVSQGDTPQVAAGRVANLVLESGMNDRAVGDGGAAYGLGQHHEDRRRAFRAMFGHEMRDGTLDEQLDFYRRDPDTGARRANQLIARPGTSAGAAAAQISRLNERPADEGGEMQKRAALAETLLKQYTAAPAPSVAPVPAPVTAAGTGMGRDGAVVVRLEHVNPPDGLRTTVQPSGDVSYGGLRIERPRLGPAP